jgi:hypothetical protein
MSRIVRGHLDSTASIKELSNIMMNMTNEEMKLELERLKAANDKLMAERQPSRPVTFQISERSGGVMALGLGSFPTTLFYSQWIRLLDAIEEQNFRAKLEEWKSANKLSMVKKAKVTRAA